MGRIYNNFQELIDDRREIFSLLFKNGFKGVVKAAWFARQHEIDSLQQNNKKLTKKDKKREQKYSQQEIELDDLKDMRRMLEAKNEDMRTQLLMLEDENKNQDSKCKELYRKLKDAEKTSDSLTVNLQTARYELAAAMKEETKAKKERAVFESQAVEARRHVDEYREYVKDLKEYASSLKKYPWEKRVSSSFNKEKTKRFPKRATSLFADL